VSASLVDGGANSYEGTGIGGSGGGVGGGGKAASPGIVLSGGSRQAMELRGPYDAANLATLFGMKDEHARAAMSTRCAALLDRAANSRAAEAAQSS
jgi:hypothetical protein